MNTPHQPSFQPIPYPTALESESGILEAIFKRTYHSLCSYAHRIVKDRELVEELVDDVFCNVWRNRKRIRINASFRSYLIASVRNKSFDCLRKIKNKRNSALDTVSEVANGQSIALEEIIFEELNQQ